MNIEETLQNFKEQGVGYLYNWSYDQVWSFGSEDKKLTLPYLVDSPLDIDRIEPISRTKAFFLGIPWYHVANIIIGDNEKAEAMQEKMKGRNIFFHVPLPKRYDQAHKLFKNPFIIWNRTRGDKNQYTTGSYLNLIGEYEQTGVLAQELASGEENCVRSINSLFELPDQVLKNYTNQKTFELYDATRKPKLKIKKID